MLSITSGTPALVRDLGDGAGVEHLRDGVGHRLGEERAGLGAHRGAPGIRVVLVDERDLDAPVGERVLQEVDRAAVQLPRRDDVLTLLGQGEERERDRGLTGGDSAQRRCRPRARRRRSSNTSTVGLAARL